MRFAHPLPLEKEIRQMLLHQSNLIRSIVGNRITVSSRRNAPI